jgi:hypothetical protein
MPGTVAVLTQFVTEAERASSICVTINTRPVNIDEYTNRLTTLSRAFLENVYP